MPERYYRITVQGVLTERLAPAFEPLRLAGVDEGRTALSGVCIDPAALYGVLDRIRDLGLELLALESCDVVPPPVVGRGQPAPANAGTFSTRGSMP
ncbi:hypothetical protein ACI797_08385 [Geodermatophilus sp. SYSU D00691]